MGTAKALREGTYRSRRGDSAVLHGSSSSEVGASLATSPEELSPLVLTGSPKLVLGLEMSAGGVSGHPCGATGSPAAPLCQTKMSSVKQRRRVVFTSIFGPIFLIVSRGEKCSI